MLVVVGEGSYWWWWGSTQDVIDESSHASSDRGTPTKLNTLTEMHATGGDDIIVQPLSPILLPGVEEVVTVIVVVGSSSLGSEGNRLDWGSV